MNDAQPAALTESSGLSGDGWCEPNVTLTVAAQAETELCQFVVWLKPEPARTSSRFAARFGDDDEFALEVPHDRLVVVQAACHAAPGETVEGELYCDNEVSEKGIDVRRLSFKIDDIRFA